MNIGLKGAASHLGGGSCGGWCLLLGTRPWAPLRVASRGMQWPIVSLHLGCLWGGSYHVVVLLFFGLKGALVGVHSHGRWVVDEEAYANGTRIGVGVHPKANTSPPPRLLHAHIAAAAAAAAAGFGIPQIPLGGAWFSQALS